MMLRFMGIIISTGYFLPVFVGHIPGYRPYCLIGILSCKAKQRDKKTVKLRTDTDLPAPGKYYCTRL
jgi:hypothetical protein